MDNWQGLQYWAWFFFCFSFLKPRLTEPGISISASLSQVLQVFPLHICHGKCSVVFFLVVTGGNYRNGALASWFQSLSGRGEQAPVRRVGRGCRQEVSRVLNRFLFVCGLKSCYSILVVYLCIWAGCDISGLSYLYL